VEEEAITKEPVIYYSLKNTNMQSEMKEEDAPTAINQVTI
tara:strand:- start:856 stop:975 length:120 start_codon:yes stop_codon:yes gene_type:complete